MSFKNDKTRLLYVPLTREEVETKAGSLAKLVAEVDDLKVRKRELGAELTAKEKILMRERSEIAECVRSKCERRVVDVFRRANVELRTWELVRDDTKVVVDTEQMSDIEVSEHRQGKLFPLQGGKKGHKTLVEEFAANHDKPLSATVEENVEAKSEVCVNELCTAPIVGAARKGRCRPCADFLRRHGTERHPGGATVLDATSEAGA